MQTNILLLLSFWCITINLNAQYLIEKQAKGKNGMVVTAHPAATKVGLDILKQGGNAIDAMVATHFALAVVYQRAGNIGGGGFMMYRANNGKIAALDFRESAPLRATRDMYLDKEGKVIDSLSRDGHLASGVPGSVAGMWEAHQKYGKLAWATLVQPAIDLAENGFILTNWEANTINEYMPDFKKLNRFQPVFVRDSLFKKGDTIVQKELAKTFRVIQQQGKAGFYEGAVAQLIADEMQAKGGLISLQDLKSYQAKWREPVQTDYKGHKIISMSPPSSGGVLVGQLLEMVEPYELDKWGFQKTKSIHLMVEAERRAYADRAKYLGDPDYYKVPTQQLLDKTYIKNRMNDFSMSKASKSENVAAGIVKVEKEETTHYSIVDKEGNAISVTTTVNGNYGSRVVVQGAGFVLNNEMDDFSAKPNTPNFYGLMGGEANAIVPQKRMLSSMTPTLVEKNGKLWLLLGTPGGSTIPTSVFQVLINVIDFKMSLLDAVHARRFHHQHSPDKLFHEKMTFSKSMIKELKKLGHKPTERKGIGQVEAIMLHEDGTLEGVADRRGDDAAAGY